MFAIGQLEEGGAWGGNRPRSNQGQSGYNSQRGRAGRGSRDSSLGRVEDNIVQQLDERMSERMNDLRGEMRNIVSSTLGKVGNNSK